MRWLLSICTAAAVAAALYAGAIVAANMGVEIALPAWLLGAAHPPQGLTTCEQSKRFRQGLVAYNDAERMMSRSDFRAADSALDRGITALGLSYDDSAIIIDDTERHLGLAHSYKSRGQLKAAVLEKCSVLVYRLSVCGEVDEGDKTYHLGPVPSHC